MLKTCKHSDCAVCKQKNDRDIFRTILKTSYPEVYICKHVAYKITDSSGAQIILSSLDRLEKGKYGYYILDIFTSDRIYMNKDNFEVICSKEGECEVTPHVVEYIPQPKKAAD